MDVVFTIVSRNYAAQAATLMGSLAAVEPAIRRVVVATDGPIPALANLAEVIEAPELCDIFPALTVQYDALELNTAVKPHAFRALLGRPGVASVAYLDPDIVLYRPLDAVREGLARAPLALTPHMTRPLRGDANPSDHTILTSGAYNLGFMAARPDADVLALLDWWAEKCRFDCRVDFANGLFTDQKWMDLAPGFVSGLALLRQPSLNLAYWNLEGRTLARGADGWTVDGEPLVFFHFSGFDPARPEVLSKHQDRIRFAARDPLAALLADYAQAMLRNGHAEATAIPYAHAALPGGRRLTTPMRRRVLRAARHGEDFSAGLTDALGAWLDAADPEAATPGLPDVTRLMDEIWRSGAEPAALFDRATLDGRLGFHDWFAEHGRAAGADPPALDAAQALALAWRAGARLAGTEHRGDEPWRGPAGEVAQWLRQPGAGGRARAVTALIAARQDLRMRFVDDPDGLTAWCLGPEALELRFDAELLPPQEIARLASAPAPLLRAARFAEPDLAATGLRQRLFAAYGLAPRARWPAAFVAALRAEWDAPAAGVPGPFPFPRLFLAIWESRTDLQRMFPLGAGAARLKYLRWLVGGGLAEYGVAYMSLPAEVRRHPLVRAARLTLRRPPADPPPPPAARGACRTLLVVESAPAALSTPADVLVFEAAAGRIRTAAGVPAPAPARVERLVFATRPGLVPADAVALHARGVRWVRAVGAWDEATVRGLDPSDVALGFVDEVWSTAPPARDDLIRRLRELSAADPLEAGLRDLLAR